MYAQVAAPHHRHTMRIERFYMHKTPVTRAQYATYLQASKYAPRTLRTGGEGGGLVLLFLNHTNKTRFLFKRIRLTGHVFD